MQDLASRLTFKNMNIYITLWLTIFLLLISAPRKRSKILRTVYKAVQVALVSMVPCTPKILDLLPLEDWFLPCLEGCYSYIFFPLFWNVWKALPFLLLNPHI